MRLVAVDIGNSSSKFALSTHPGEVGDLHSIENDSPFESRRFVWLESDSPHHWVACSVNRARAEELKEWIRRHRPEDQLHLIRPADIPLASDVQSRESLGRDRLLGAWQARQMLPQGRLVVIDAGTAVTVDLVTSDSVFAGGVIFPGAKTMLTQLAKQTAALPDLSSLGIRGGFELDTDYETGRKQELPTIGKSTQQAILLGVYQTQISTLKSIVASIRSQSSEPLHVVATGGGTQELRAWLPQDWIYDPLLLLRAASSLGHKRRHEA